MHRIGMPNFCASWIHTSRVSGSAFVLSFDQLERYCCLPGVNGPRFIPMTTALFEDRYSEAIFRHLSRYTRWVSQSCRTRMSTTSSTWSHMSQGSIYCFERVLVNTLVTERLQVPPVERALSCSRRTYKQHDVERIFLLDAYRRKGGGWVAWGIGRRNISFHRRARSGCIEVGAWFKSSSKRSGCFIEKILLGCLEVDADVRSKVSVSS